MSNYRPRRATKRWMEGAPEYILSVHDNGGKTADRYTVYFGGSMYEESLRRNVLYLAFSEQPNHPQGFSQWGEGPAASREASGPKIRWLDLPENLRNHVMARATQTYGEEKAS